MMSAIAMLSLPVHHTEAAPEYDRVYLKKETGKAVVRDVEGNKIFSNKDAQLSLEHAMKNAKTVMVTEGKYNCYNRVEVPRSNITLIIDQDATVRAAEDADMSEWPELVDKNGDLFRQLIYNRKYNNIRIINLGTLIQPDVGRGPHPDPNLGKYNSGAAIWFDGRESRIRGGLVFSPGTIKNAPDGYGHGVGIFNADAVRVPFLYSDGMGQATLWMENTRGCSVGTVINEPKGKGEQEGESIDLNAYNEFNVINTVIGVGKTSGNDQVLDINASKNILVGQVVTAKEARVSAKEVVTITGGAGERWADGTDGSKGTTIGERVTISDLKETRMEIRGPVNLRKVDKQMDVFCKFVIKTKNGRTLTYGGSQTIRIAD